jgi:hypothetical protein
MTNKIIETSEGIFIEFTPFLFYHCDMDIFISMIGNNQKFDLLKLEKFPDVDIKYRDFPLTCVKVTSGGPIPKLINNILNHPSRVITNDELKGFLDFNKTNSSSFNSRCI